MMSKNSVSPKRGGIKASVVPLTKPTTGKESYGQPAAGVKSSGKKVVPVSK